MTDTSERVQLAELIQNVCIGVVCSLLVLVVSVCLHVLLHPCNYTTC